MGWGTLKGKAPTKTLETRHMSKGKGITPRPS
jgi:hypothetical protein